MRNFLLISSTTLLLFAIISVTSAISITSASSTCSSITSPAPCGQSSDSQERCLSKGCCYDTSKSYPCYYSTGNAVPIDTVHVIQASHFDAGFAYTIRDVLQLWWYTHFPRALSLGLELEQSVNNPNNNLALHFTAQCWLIDLFFNCPTNVPGLPCPTSEQIANVTLAIQKGFLTWHAFPFNSEYELHSIGMMNAGIARCHALDDQFGFTRKATASQRDVPGTTRSVIKTLLENNVTVFSNGVNGASTPPFVPRAFLWQDSSSGLSLPTLIHPYGYGDIQREDAVIVPGLSHALVFAWRGDNAGPPTNVAEIASNYATVQQNFPGAKVIFSTFDNFTQHLLVPSVLATLPIITSELGDTWIHGSGSDPLRLAFLKLCAVKLAACIASKSCSLTDPIIANFTRLALKNGEHTWGKDVKTFLHDSTYWTNQQLESQLAKNASNFFDIVNSWIEQRAWGITYALEALAGHPLGDDLQTAYNALRPIGPPDTTGFSPFTAGTLYNAGRWSLSFDTLTGGIDTLIDTSTSTTWASKKTDGSLLAWPHYLTLSGDDYAIFTGPEPGGYYPLPGDSPSWYKLDFGKPNMSSANPLHQEVDATLSALYIKEESTTTTFLVKSIYTDSTLHTYYGAPAEQWLTVIVPKGNDKTSTSTINFSFEIFEKTPTRLAEGLFLRFNISDPVSWRVNSLDGSIDPFDIVPGGNHHLHGFSNDSTGGGISATKKNGQTLQITSVTIGLAGFGKPSYLPAPVWSNATDPNEGANFNLLNNGWGTNYPQWIPFTPLDANQRWDFAITAL